MPSLQLKSDDTFWAELSFEETRIEALNEPYPYLRINVSLRKRIADKAGQLLQIGGTLFMRRGSQELAVAELRLNSLGVNLEDRGFYLEIPILHQQIKAVEDAREDRAPDFRLRVWALVAVSVPSGVHTFAILKGQTSFQIPKDLWVERLLPSMGYGSFRLITLAFPSFAGEEAFREKVITEVEGAQADFLRGNHDKVVLQCRNALQALLGFVRLDLKGEKATFENRARAFCEQVLQPAVGKSKAELVQSLILAPWRLFSAPGKPGQKIFSRQDAELAFHLTVTVLSYVGQIFARSGR